MGVCSHFQHEFWYSSKDIGTYPIDIELLVDRTETPDGTRGEDVRLILESRCLFQLFNFERE